MNESLADMLFAARFHTVAQRHMVLVRVKDLTLPGESQSQEESAFEGRVSRN